MHIHVPVMEEGIKMANGLTLDVHSVLGSL